MNNTFSLRRTLLYARKHYVENGRNYLYLLLAFLLLLALDTWFFGIHRPNSFDFMISALFCLFLINGSVLWLNCRSHYDLAQMPIAYTLPATALEKYLVIWFNSTIAPILLFTLTMIPIAGITGFSGYNIDEIPIEMIWLCLLFVQSVVLLACCWTKGNPLKVLLPLAGICILFLIGYFWINDIRWNGGWTSISYIFENGWVSMDSPSAGVSYRIREFSSDNLIVTMFLGFWSLINWAAAYFKFKERTLK